MNDKKEKILIVGLGLLGGSYAAALTERGYEVGAIDISAESLEYALDRGIIAHGESQPTEDYVAKFDILVLALYPAAAVQWIEKYRGMLSKGALVFDVTGVKCGVVERIQSLLPDGAEFVGAHPMAGREVSGVKNATANLFEGANYIVTPTERNSEATIARCERLGREIGCGRISRLSPREHDEMIGFVSQLTHCIAVSLMSCKDTDALADYTGDSFRDLTRIAKINENMWSELFLANREQLLAQMDIFSEKFGELRQALDERDAESIKKIMITSTERRKKFDQRESENK